MTVTTEPATVTVTELSTTTVAATETATQTAYAQCQPDNFLSEYKGSQIKAIFLEAQTMILGGIRRNSAEECCISCAADPACGQTAYRPYDNRCYRFGPLEAGTCPAPNTPQMGFLLGQADAALTISNGKCGTWIERDA